MNQFQKSKNLSKVILMIASHFYLMRALANSGCCYKRLGNFWVKEKATKQLCGSEATNWKLKGLQMQEWFDERHICCVLGLCGMLEIYSKGF